MLLFQEEAPNGSSPDAVKRTFLEGEFYKLVKECPDFISSNTTSTYENGFLQFRTPYIPLKTGFLQPAGEK